MPRNTPVETLAGPTLISRRLLQSPVMSFVHWSAHVRLREGRAAGRPKDRGLNSSCIIKEASRLSREEGVKMATAMKEKEPTMQCP